MTNGNSITTINTMKVCEPGGGAAFLLNHDGTLQHSKFRGPLVVEDQNGRTRGTGSSPLEPTERSLVSLS